jgi:hypothetical protein
LCHRTPESLWQTRCAPVPDPADLKSQQATELFLRLAQVLSQCWAHTGSESNAASDDQPPAGDFSANTRS